MTTAAMPLTEPAEKGANIDVLRQKLQFMAQRLMELGVAGLRSRLRRKEPGAAEQQQWLPRTHWDTRAGSVELKFPELR